MSRARDIVLIGGSAGGIEAAKAIVGALPRDFPGAVFVVLHRPSHPLSILHSDALAMVVSWGAHLRRVLRTTSSRSSVVTSIWRQLTPIWCSRMV